MHRAVAAIVAIAAALAAGTAHAAGGGTQSTSTKISNPPDLANILKGTTQTSYVIQPGGSFSRTGGDFLRIRGNSGSLVSTTVTLKCDTTSGNGSGTCGNDKTVTVTINAAPGGVWPSTVQNFNLGSLTGASTPTTTSSGTSATFTLTCIGGASGKCLDHHTITFDLGMTVVFNATGTNTGSTTMPFTVTATWQP